MNYVKLLGGLGNQLFQYAYAYSLFKKDKNVKLDASEFSYYELHKLKIHNYKIILSFCEWDEVKKYYIFNNLFLSHKIKIFSKKIFIFLQKKLNNNSIIFENLNDYNLKKKDYLFDGYWQALKFVEKNKSDLLKQIKLKNYSKKHKKLIKLILAKKNSVAVHIRQYSRIRGEDEFHGNISLKYIEKATEIIEKKIKNPFYFVFTNSNEWVKNNLNFNEKNYMLIKGFKDFEDLQSISKCKHQIISNSTFGWWGAWLNQNKNKLVIFPRNWYLKRKNPNNLFPKKWLKI